VGLGGNDVHENRRSRYMKKKSRLNKNNMSFKTEYWFCLISISRENRVLIHLLWSLRIQ